MEEIVKRNIKQNKIQHQITKKLEIPDFIQTKNDFYEFERSTTKPNYVQSTEVTGKLLK